MQQIATKYYKFKAGPGKQAMTPKLYEQLSSKFVESWGDHAGWAHSVCLVANSCEISIEARRFKVMFTADLKAFENYGLEKEALPASSPIKEPKEKRKRDVEANAEAEQPPPTRRKRGNR